MDLLRGADRRFQNNPAAALSEAIARGQKYGFIPRTGERTVGWGGLWDKYNPVGGKNTVIPFNPRPTQGDVQPDEPAAPPAPAPPGSPRVGPGGRGGGTVPPSPTAPGGTGGPPPAPTVMTNPAPVVRNNPGGRGQGVVTQTRLTDYHNDAQGNIIALDTVTNQWVPVMPSQADLLGSAAGAR
jgi:hypothetical protein